VISDQYATKSIITTGGRTFTGMVGAGGASGYTVLLEDGRSVTVGKDQVDEIVPINKSVMPEGLLNELEQEDVADLLEFLTSPNSVNVATPAVRTVK
jgi:putative heme-binding domain-containing protein